MTVLPPNGPSCTGLNNENNAVITASSLHQGGCHVLMTDGAVKFITESIEAGNRNATPVANAFNNVGSSSPFGLWGALGTRAGKEVVADF